MTKSQDVEKEVRREHAALRDQFAAAALAAILTRDRADPTRILAVAQSAYEYADAMLAARDTQP